MYEEMYIKVYLQWLGYNIVGPQYSAIVLQALHFFIQNIAPVMHWTNYLLFKWCCACCICNIEE